jgi:thioredoxin 1
MKILLICIGVLVLNTALAAQPSTPAHAKPAVTFIELGSVSCIPCKKMQPVMKAIERSFAGKVEVVFYDVWTPAQKPFAQKYGIRLIPTQVFLDANGKEFFRHEGFFPEAEIVKLLTGRGVTPVPPGA